MAACRCETLPPLVDVGMGNEDGVFDTLGEKARHGPPLWWLSAQRCEACGQWWLVAADERINDVFLMRRLADAQVESIQRRREWPADFSRFAEVLRLGGKCGHRVVYGDPESPALVETAIDLAREEDGIRVARLASLLQIDTAQATRLADLAERKASVRITR